MKVDLKAGVIMDGSIRYILMRPDVLMGVGHEMAGVAQLFVHALEQSAFKNGQRSFASYQSQGRLDADPLSETCRIAASLGWGAWSLVEQDSSLFIEVPNSPFAEGFGQSSSPVCGPIVGILKAVASVTGGSSAHIEEISCRAQGADRCRFRFR